MKKTTLLIITVFAILINSCTNNANISPNYFNNNVWNAVIDDFQLADHLNKPQVQIEITKYLKNKKDLEKSLIRASYYLYHIQSVIKERSLPGEIALIPIIESQYQPFAYSWAGATGIWQMMPGTASGLGLTINWWVDERRNIIP